MQNSGYKNASYFVKEGMKKNSNLLRLGIIITNTLNVILYGMFFSYTLSDDYYNLKNSMNQIVSIENRAPFLSITEKDQCVKKDNEYQELIYRWSGTSDGCICQKQLFQKNNIGEIEETPKEAFKNGKYIFRNVCQQKGVKCHSRIMIKKHESENLYNWKSEKKFCVKLVEPTMTIPYKECYNNSAYKLCNSSICIKNELDCPITGISLENDTISLK